MESQVFLFGCNALYEIKLKDWSRSYCFKFDQGFSHGGKRVAMHLTIWTARETRVPPLDCVRGLLLQYGIPFETH